MEPSHDKRGSLNMFESREVCLDLTHPISSTPCMQYLTTFNLQMVPMLFRKGRVDHTRPAPRCPTLAFSSGRETLPRDVMWLSAARPDEATTGKDTWGYVFEDTMFEVG